MTSVKDLKLRIRAIKNTQQITKAMKMVAAARIRRAESHVKAGRPYAQKMGEMVRNLLGSVEEPHPYFEVRPVKRIALLLVTGDKGLCGSYNSALIRLAQNFLARRQNVDVDILTVGHKGRHFFLHRGHKMREHFTPSFYPEYVQAEEIAQELSKIFCNDYCDEIWAVYARFISAMSQKPTEMRLLPFAPDAEAGQKSEAAAKNKAVFIFEPDPKSVLNTLLPKYLAVLIFNILMEARASELGARLVAMGSATDNAKKLIDSLTLQFYRARQESITKEILEVASGAEALVG